MKAYQFTVWTYTSTLTLGLEDEGLPIHCLDIHFYFNTTTNSIACATHSKEMDPKYQGLPFTRFPHMHSFMHSAILYNTFLGELYRYKRTNTTIYTFANKTVDTLHRLDAKDYNITKLRLKLRHFIERNLPFYNHQHGHSAQEYVMKRYNNTPNIHL